MKLTLNRNETNKSQFKGQKQSLKQIKTNHLTEKSQVGPERSLSLDNLRFQ